MILCVLCVRALCLCCVSARTATATVVRVLLREFFTYVSSSYRSAMLKLSNRTSRSTPSWKPLWWIQCCGHGTFTRNDGAVYEGEWRNGVRCGRGKMTYS